jgi:exonuclease SbcC
MIFEKTQAMKLIQVEENKLEKLIVLQSDKEKEWKVAKKTVEDNIKIKEKKIKEDEERDVTEVLKRLSETKEQIRLLLTKQTESIRAKYAQNLIEYNDKLDKLNTSQLSIAQEYKEYRQLSELINNTRTNLAIISSNHKQLNSQSYDSKEESITKELKDIESKVSETNAKLFQINRQISIFEFWKDAYSPSGIPSMLVDEAIPFMNHKMSEYLDYLTNGRYVVSFDTLSTTKAGEFRDKISVHLLDTQTQSNTRGQFSGGQTRIVDIATILTLGDLQANIQNMFVNILLFDEIFDSLDAENISNVAKVLNKIKKGKSIYIISHTHQDGIDVDEVLAINK